MNPQARLSLDKMLYLKKLSAQHLQYIVDYLRPQASQSRAAFIEKAKTYSATVEALDKVIQEHALQMASIEEHRDGAMVLFASMSFECLGDSDKQESMEMASDVISVFNDNLRAAFDIGMNLQNMRTETILS